MIAGLLLLSAMNLMGPAAPAAVLPSTWRCKRVELNVRGPEQASPGDMISYDIILMNGSDCQLQGATLIDYPPRQSLFVEAAPEPNPPSADIDDTPFPIMRIEWTPLDIEPRSSRSYSVAVRAQAGENSWLTNTVCFQHPDTGRICEAFDTRIIR